MSNPDNAYRFTWTIGRDTVIIDSCFAVNQTGKKPVSAVLTTTNQQMIGIVLL